MKKRLIFSFLYILFIGVLLLGTHFVLKACSPDYEKTEYAIQKGDTYDILADRFGIKEDRRTWRERVKRLNGKSDSWLYEGETIYVLMEAEGEDGYYKKQAELENERKND